MNDAEYAQAVRDGGEWPCPVESCSRTRRIEYVMCGACWDLVPVALQNRVYRAWGARCRFRDARSIAAHQAAVDEAVAVAHKARRARAERRSGQATLDI